MEIDASGSRLEPEAGRRSVPPHPDPLPEGEGIAPVRPVSAERSRFVERLENILPLLTGEGRGEGDCALPGVGGTGEDIAEKC